jgi:hypothetical protein
MKMCQPMGNTSSAREIYQPKGNTTSAVKMYQPMGDTSLAREKTRMFLTLYYLSLAKYDPEQLQSLKSKDCIKVTYFEFLLIKMLNEV